MKATTSILILGAVLSFVGWRMRKDYKEKKHGIYKTGTGDKIYS